MVDTCAVVATTASASWTCVATRTTAVRTTPSIVKSGMNATAARKRKSRVRTPAVRHRPSSGMRPSGNTRGTICDRKSHSSTR